MAKYSAAPSFAGAYRVSPEGLGAITSTIQTLIGKQPRVEVSFTGGHSLEHQGLDEFGDDPLYRAQEIHRITVRGWSDDSTAHARVSMSNSLAVHIEVDGEKEKCLSALNDITHEVNGARTWYWWLYKYETLTAFALMLGGFLLLITFVPRSDSVLEQNVRTFMAAGASLLLFLNGKTLLFRRMEFLMGRGLERARWREGARRVIFVTIGLGIAVALASNFIWKQAGF